MHDDGKEDKDDDDPPGLERYVDVRARDGRKSLLHFHVSITSQEYHSHRSIATAEALENQRDDDELTGSRSNAGTFRSTQRYSRGTTSKIQGKTIQSSSRWFHHG